MHNFKAFISNLIDLVVVASVHNIVLQLEKIGENKDTCSKIFKALWLEQQWTYYKSKQTAGASSLQGLSEYQHKFTTSRPCTPAEVS